MTTPAENRRRRVTLLISMVLVLAVLIAYGQILECDFVGFDDIEYVTKNRYVQKGLTLQNVVWAFTSFHSANWHPLTWLSHMLDCELYGLNPVGHHWTSLQFHIANTILLFFILQGMTGALWRSAVVAALFALHPLHVESVAWVAERKDVLSAFLGFLTIMAYQRYAENSSRAAYALTMLCFGLGLMAKPMLVTLPFVLLLLDYWPLGRWQPVKGEGITSRGISGFDFQVAGALIYEKIPLFALTASSCIVTFLAQRNWGAVESLAALPLHLRVGNAFVSYVKYIINTVWPAHLIAYYPHPGETLPAWQAFGAALLVFAAAFAAIRSARHYPYAVVGLFWYLGTLVPVVGLVQVGEQAMADRYTYIPLTGIFIVFVWGAFDLMSIRRIRKASAAFLAGTVLLLFGSRTFLQVGHWRNGITLFENALSATPDSHLAHNNLGTALYNAGRLDEAVVHYRKAVALSPGFTDALSNLGAALNRQGNYDLAAFYLQKALERQPDSAEAHEKLGTVMFSLQKHRDAVGLFKEAIRLDPEYANAYSNLATALTAMGKYGEAASYYSEALKLEPENSDTHYKFGNLMLEQNRLEAAASHFVEAIRINPEEARAYHQLGGILYRQGKPEAAVKYLKKALRIDPGYTQAWQNLIKIQGNEKDH